MTAAPAPASNSIRKSPIPVQDLHEDQRAPEVQKQHCYPGCALAAERSEISRAGAQFLHCPSRTMSARLYVLEVFSERNAFARNADGASIICC